MYALDDDQLARGAALNGLDQRRSIADCGAVDLDDSIADLQAGDRPDPVVDELLDHALRIDHGPDLARRQPEGVLALERLVERGQVPGRDRDHQRRVTLILVD